MDYDIYGSKSTTAPELRTSIEQALGIEFQERDSDHYGDYYTVTTDEQEVVVLLQNTEPDAEGYLPRDQYADFASVLEVNRTERADEYRQKLAPVPGLDFLTRRSL